MPKLENKDIQNKVDSISSTSASSTAEGNIALFGTIVTKFLKFLTRSGTTQNTEHQSLRGAADSKIIDNEKKLLSPEIEEVFKNKISKKQKKKMPKFTLEDLSEVAQEATKYNPAKINKEKVKKVKKKMHIGNKKAREL